jgi:glucosamine-6-phosphate deaminase
LHNKFLKDMMQETETLKIVKTATRDELGKLAAYAVFEKISELMQSKQTLNMIFAAAPSQNEFLKYLKEMPIEWNRINAFHMDEYLALAADAPQGFGNFLRNAIFDKVPFKSVNLLNGNNSNPLTECDRYAQLLAMHPCDIVCMGIGENAHIAFNDPHVADFDDPIWVKVVELDEKCRIQQVNDGCFAKVEAVPKRALTLTVPALMAAKHVFCMVPGEKKAEAVAHTLNAPVSEVYPSTIIRTHPSAILFIDQQSASALK